MIFQYGVLRFLYDLVRIVIVEDPLSFQVGSTGTSSLCEVDDPNVIRCQTES